MAQSKVRFEAPTSDDEIDLDSGFLMLSQAIPLSAAPLGPGPSQPGPTPPPPGLGPIPPGGPRSGPTPPVPDKLVQLSLTADRDQLYTAGTWSRIWRNWQEKWNSIRAESQDGFDKRKLQNGVLEPLREIELIE